MENSSREPQERVEYRRWPSTGNLIALYPDRKIQFMFAYCDCVAQDGTHSAAMFDSTMRFTRPATKAEFEAAVADYQAKH